MRSAAETDTSRPRSLALVIPAFNEEVALEASVLRQRDLLRAYGVPFEIVIVDDGSTDGTHSVASRLASGSPEIKVVRSERNRGVGAAIWAGYASARTEWVFANAVDEPLDLADLPRLFDQAADADVIVVARHDRGANPLFRRLTSLVNYWLIRLLFRVPLRDFQFVQIYRRATLEGIAPRAQDAFMPPELLLRTMRRGARVRQVSAVFHPRRSGSSHYNDPRRYLRALREMLAFWRELRRDEEDQRG